MQVTILHNVTEDGLGRPVGLIDGYREEHQMRTVFAYASNHTDPAAAAAEAFHLFNVGDDPAFGTPSDIAVAYRARGLRSLSVGDVVVAGDVPLACASFGWNVVAHPAALV